MLYFCRQDGGDCSPSAPSMRFSALSLAPHQHPCLLINAPFVSHPHYPLLCTITLASLVKGRWIDGKAQTVVLLHFTCDISAFFIRQTFRRQDGGIATPTFRSAPTFQNRTIPPKTANTLASLVKGRWIDGKPQTVTLLRLLAICLPFLYCILFRRQDGGIATPPALNLLPLPKVSFWHPQKFGRLPFPFLRLLR